MPLAFPRAQANMWPWGCGCRFGENWDPPQVRSCDPGSHQEDRGRRISLLARREERMSGIGRLLVSCRGGSWLAPSSLCRGLYGRWKEGDVVERDGWEGPQ
jgi:hypothetical protein